MDADNVTSWR